MFCFSHGWQSLSTDDDRSSQRPCSDDPTASSRQHPTNLNCAACVTNSCWQGSDRGPGGSAGASPSRPDRPACQAECQTHELEAALARIIHKNDAILRKPIHVSMLQRPRQKRPVRRASEPVADFDGFGEPSYVTREQSGLADPAAPQHALARVADGGLPRRYAVTRFVEHDPQSAVRQDFRRRRIAR